MIRRKIQVPLLDCESQSVRTVHAALYELANVDAQAHLVMQRALILQVLPERPAQAVNSVYIPAVRRAKTCVLAAVQCVVLFVAGVSYSHCEPVFLKAVQRWSNKAGMVSQIYRSAWPGKCAVRGGGSGT